MLSRKNENTNEKEIITIRLLFPIVIFILLLFVSLAIMIVLIVLSVSYGGVAPAISAPLVSVALINLAITIANFILYSTSKGHVTNKRVHGRIKLAFYRNTYSFKLDHIVGIEIKSIFFIKTLIFKVSHGNGTAEKVRLISVIHGNDIYHQVVKMIQEVRCDTDVIIEGLDKGK